jgi:hypothetical protein
VRVPGVLLLLAASWIAFACASEAPVDEASDGGLGSKGGEGPAAGASGATGGELGGEGGGDGTSRCAGAEYFATEVTDFAFGTGQSFGQDHFPEWVLGGPEGNASGVAATSGVVSLGDGGTVTLSFGTTRGLNGDGPDLLIFENPFLIGGDPETPFAELARVEVSLDGVEWYEFPCDPVSGIGCAGVKPVLVNFEKGDLPPYSPEVAGGDAFDLDELGLDEVRFVRITDLPGDSSGIGGVFDLDAVSWVHASCASIR